MGIAVIFLTLIIRLILLPLSLMEERSAEDRREITNRAKELRDELSHDPIAMRQETKALFKTRPKVVASEIFTLAVQVMISLMLWRIFTRGLEGADTHFIYSFMPKVEGEFNLLFLGYFDLSHTSFILNAIQSTLIFVLETLSMYVSPYPPSRGEVVRLQLLLPLMSFVIFMGLPAGKKVFIITTLSVSIVITLFKAVRRRFEEYRLKQEAAAAVEEPPIVVEVK